MDQIEEYLLSNLLLPLQGSVTWLVYTAFLVLIGSTVTLAVTDRRKRPSAPTSRSATIDCVDDQATISTLDDRIIANLQQGTETVLIVDTNNVRGEDDFRIWNSDLLDLLTKYKTYMLKASSSRHETKHQLLHIIYAIDHGCQPQVLDYPPFHGLVVFAGPHRTADDVIVQASRYFTSTKKSRHFETIVVTSDWDLTQRCLRCNERSTTRKHKGKRHSASTTKSIKASVHVVSSRLLVTSLDSMLVVDTGQTDVVSQKAIGSEWLCSKLSQMEADLWKYTHPKAPATGNGVCEHSRLSKQAIYQSHNLVKGPTMQDYPRLPFVELTWHRVLVAESFRRLMLLVPSQQYQSDDTSQATTIPERFKKYKEFYEGHQMDNSSGTPIPTMFLGHRIRNQPEQLLQFRRYFDSMVVFTDGDDSMLKAQCHETERTCSSPGLPLESTIPPNNSLHETVFGEYFLESSHVIELQWLKQHHI